MLKRSWAEIDLDALAHNFQTLREHLGPLARLMGVVKADAYGHGAAPVARELESLGCVYMAVSNLEEARELRQAGVGTPILQLGLTPPEQAGSILENNITQTIWDEASGQAFAQAAQAAGRVMRVHIKLDTGMSRLGFPCGEGALDAVCRVCALPGLDAEGIFTHFSSASEEDADSRDYTLLQLERFETMLRRLEERGVRFRLRHCANSGAAVLYPRLSFDLLRPGIALYGVSPLADRLDLRPVMALRSVVGAVRELPPGSAISYGRSFRTERASRVGVLPIGYADGLHRSLSNRWRVWTPCGMAPIVGRICMDMCMIDLTDLPQVKAGDEVEVYGPRNSVNAAAAAAGTIPYELTCAVSKRVPRDRKSVV